MCVWLPAENQVSVAVELYTADSFCWYIFFAFLSSFQVLQPHSTKSRTDFDLNYCWFLMRRQSTITSYVFASSVCAIFYFMIYFIFFTCCPKLWHKKQNKYIDAEWIIILKSYPLFYDKKITQLRSFQISEKRRFSLQFGYLLLSHTVLAYWLELPVYQVHVDKKLEFRERLFQRKILSWRK